MARVLQIVPSWRSENLAKAWLTRGSPNVVVGRSVRPPELQSAIECYVGVSGKVRGMSMLACRSQHAEPPAGLENSGIISYPRTQNDCTCKPCSARQSLGYVVLASARSLNHLAPAKHTDGPTIAGPSKLGG